MKMGVKPFWKFLGYKIGINISLYKPRVCYERGKKTNIMVNAPNEINVKCVSHICNGLFAIGSNGTLLTGVPLDHESNATLKVLVRVTDQSGGSAEKEFVVTVLDDDTEDDWETKQDDATGKECVAALGFPPSLPPPSPADAGDASTTPPPGARP